MSTTLPLAGTATPGRGAWYVARALNGAILAGAVAVTAVLAVRVREAGTPKREAATQVDTADQGWPTYCGVYAVCRAARALGKKCHFEQLLDARYISSRAGSTLEDLTRAARKLGLESRPLAGMNAAALRQITCPAVLHVKYYGGSPAYDHWTLFMGVEGEEAVVYDGPHETPKRVPLARLMALWDGTALLLHASPPAAFPLRAAAAAQYLLYGSAFLSGLLLIAWAAVRRESLRNVTGVRRSLAEAAFQAVMLLAFAILAAGAAALGAAHGPLAHVQTTAEMTRDNVVQLLPRYGPRDLARLKAEPGVRFVDPRSESEFNAGHLEGAIHLPTPQVFARGGLADRLRELPPARRWVVYESGNTCRAEWLADQLWRAGIDNLAIAELDASALAAK